MLQGGYGTTARMLHWITFLFVLGMVPAGVVMTQEGLDRGLQDQLFIFHKNAGVILLVLVLVRLAWRALVPPPPLPAGTAEWQRQMSLWVHRLLYTMLIFMAVTGYLRVTLGGFPVEVLDALGMPRPPRNDAMAAIAQRAHFLGKFLLMGLILVHVGAALGHAIVKRDGVFSRMWPPIRRSG